MFAWNDGWRKHPLLSNNAKFNLMLPGFWWGLGAFGVYFVGSKLVFHSDLFAMNAACVTEKSSREPRRAPLRTNISFLERFIHIINDEHLHPHGPRCDRSVDAWHAQYVGIHECRY